MAYEVNLQGRIIDTNNVALPGLTVDLKQVLENDNIRGIKTYQTTGTETTDGNGFVVFSGISSATYDAFVTHASGTFSLQNIIVKNEYPVVPGGTEALFESRTYIRSQETVGPSGIMVSNEITPVWIRTGSIDNAQPAESGVNSGYVTNYWEDRIDGTVYSGTLAMNKELGDRSYHSNQDTYQMQRFTLRIVL